MRALFCPGERRKVGKKEKEEKGRGNSRHDYVCTVTAKIPRWRRRYDTDFPRVLRPAGKRNEERYHDQTGMRRKARFTSSRASASASATRTRARAVEHLFEMIPRCLIAQADIIPRAGKRDDFKQRKPPGEA